MMKAPRHARKTHSQKSALLICIGSHSARSAAYISYFSVGVGLTPVRHGIAVIALSPGFVFLTLPLPLTIYKTAIISHL